MIKLVEISKLYPHPHNPRQNLGDLSELAESIKAQGILQNLTVVPNHLWYDSDKKEFGRYTVIIGHRRLEAAKLAGLTEIPCSILEMDEKTQIATMLLENIQRNDLTIWEQAQGVQMMLDLGESVTNISDKTGFSETTVRRRVKLLELDQEKFKKSVEKGATLMDFAELEKIHDLALRNKVLDKIGTQNFKWELQNALDKEKREANAALIVAELEKFATEVKDSNGLQYVNTFNTLYNSNVTAPDDAEEYFFKDSGNYITLYKKYVQSEASAAQDEKRKEQQERRTALDEISKRAYQLRSDFISKISNTMAKKNMSVIIEYSLRAMFIDYLNLDYGDLAEFLGIEINEDDECSFEDIAENVAAQPERHLLVAAYLALDSRNEHYYNWNNLYQDNEELNIVYDFLEKLGYEISDEEQTMRNGTHRLFV